MLGAFTNGDVILDNGVLGHKKWIITGPVTRLDESVMYLLTLFWVETKPVNNLLVVTREELVNNFEMVKPIKEGW